MARKEKGAVLITGASTGIGRATALHLAENGYRVFAGVRKKADADSVSEEASGDLTPVTIDVTKQKSIDDARAKIEEAVGEDGLYGLVNNAGIGVGGPIEFLPLADFKKVIDVNLLGQVAVTQAFLPLIRPAKGRIINITSIGGKIATPFLSPYSASKFALEAVTDCLRREVAPWGIEAIAIEPGSIATPIWDKAETSTEEFKQGSDPELQRLYGTQIERMEKATRETADRGIPPLAVAKTIRRALEAKRPKTRYLVGADAKLMRQVERATPDRVFDRMMLRRMRMPNEAPPGT